jgi:hypothetical protein
MSACRPSLLPMPETTVKSFDSGPSGLLQRKSEQALSRSQTTAEAPPIVHDVLRSPGQPLDAASRAFMEPRFGYDFSRVRVHSDSQAAKSARAVNAQAYTVGSNIVFGANRGGAGNLSQQRLLAHELAHVVQQGAAPDLTPRGFALRADSAAESEAALAGNAIADGRSFRPVLQTPPLVARQSRDDAHPAPDSPRRAPVGEAERGVVMHNEANYGGDRSDLSELQYFTGRESYELVRYNAELDVIVRIRLVMAHSQQGHRTPGGHRLRSVPPGVADQWRNGISSFWNNRFFLRNRSARLRVVFLPVFVGAGGRAHHQVTVHTAGWSGQTGESNWRVNDNDRVVAHEFGHMVGAIDEHSLPATSEEIPASFPLTAEERRLSNFQDVTGERRPPRQGGYDVPFSVMNGERDNPDQQIPRARHLRRILNFFNERLRQPNEALFDVISGSE